MRQRTISDFFWRDPEISDLSQEDKATLLYFLTSPSSNIIGCYQVVWMIAAAEMGWTKDQLLVVARRLKTRDLIDFTDEGWIWVKAWWKHNSSKGAFSPKLFGNAKKQCQSIPVVWIKEFTEWLKNADVDTLSIGYPCPMDTLCHTPSDRVSIPYQYANDTLSETAETHENTGDNTLCHTLSDTLYHTVPHTPPPNHNHNIQYVTLTTTPNPSANEASGQQPKPTPVVVVDDLIFSPLIRPDQREAILTLLSSSGVSPNLWQLILDELHGAQLAQTIENPVGYVRGIALRANQGTFHPELALKIAEKRRNQNRPAPVIVEAPQARRHADQDEINRLPTNIRASLTRMAEHKIAGSTK